MTPDEFREALAALISATTTLVTLPLEEMAAYTETVEELGADNPAFTDERRETTSHVARMVAAAIHLRETTAMGGVS